MCIFVIIMKKLHLILLLTFLPLLMAAQSPESVALYAKGKDLYNAGDYKKAAETFIEVLELDKSESPRNLYNLSFVEGWIASSYYKAGDIESARKHDKYYYELEPVDRTKDKMPQLIECALRLADAHDYNVAVSLLERLLKLEIELIGPANQYVKEAYSMLAGYEFGLGNIRKCKSYNESIKETCRAISDKVTTKGWNADGYLFDAIMAEAAGDAEAAKREADKAWQIVGDEIVGQSFALKETFGFMMRYYTGKGDYDTAMRLAADVENAYRALEGEDVTEAAPIVLYITEFYLGSMKSKEAASLAEYALDKVSDEYGRARLIYNAGLAYLNLGDWQEAKVRLHKSLDTFVDRQNDIDAALAYFALGRCYDGQRNFEQAKECYKETLRFIGKNKERYARQYYDALLGLAAMESRTGKYEAALARLAETRDVIKAYPRNFNNNDLAHILKEEAVCYNGKNDNAVAIAKLRESVELFERGGAPMLYTYVDAATELLSLLLTDSENEAEAEALQRRLSDICEGDTEIAKLMKLKIYGNVYLVLMKRMRFDEALQVNEKLLESARDYPDFNTFEAMNNRLMMLIALGRSEDARDEIGPMTLSTVEKYGKYSSQYLTVLKLASIYLEQTGDLSRIDMAASYGEDMIDIANMIYRADDPEHFANIISGARLLINVKPQAAAEVILKTLKQTPRSVLEANRATVVDAYTSLATIKNTQWIMSEAADYIEKAVETIGDGTNILNPSATYVTAGIIYTRLNRFAEAEKMLLKAVDYVTRTNTDNMLGAAVIYSALGDLYSKMGQTSVAAEYRKKCRQMQAEQCGDNKLMLFLNLVADIWPKYHSGDKGGCLSDIDAIDSVVESMKGMYNIDNSMPSRLRTQYYLYEGDLEMARIYAGLLNLWVNNYDDRLMRAKVYSACGEYDKALEDAEAAIGIGKDLYGKSSVSLVEPVVYAAEAKMMLGDKQGAIENFRRAYNIGCDYISNNILTLTAAQRADFWNSNFGFYRATLPHVTATRLRDTEMNGLLYDAMLFSNGLLFTADKSITDIVQKSPEDVRLTYGDWMFKKDLLKRLVAQSEATTDESQAENFKRNIAEITGEVSTLERQLLDRIGETTGNDWRLPKTTWQQVRKALPRGAAAIEFVDYEMGDSISALIALILTKDSKLPVLREVCKGDHDFITNDLMFADREFTDKFFKTFADDIAGCTEVYFVPQGALCSVALESLPVSDGILPSKPEFYRLSSTRELVRARRGKGKDRAATIYGGLKYDMDVDSMVADAGRYPELRERGFNADNLLSARVSRKGDVVIPELKGALVEVEAVSDFYKKVTGREPLLKTGADGTESSIKALSGKYGNIFHISTHGFFVADNSQADNLALSQSETLTAEDIALERSGLLMAGAANRYLGLEDIPSDIDDGILTAAEIARLNLENVDLAVLSACETGLGQVTGDGVFGLQRGFKKAGVNSILMSLWKVDDDATCRLITEFYRHWLGDSASGIAATDKHTALERAKQIVRETPGWENPRYWAAFILLDAID